MDNLLQLKKKSTRDFFDLELEIVGYENGMKGYILRDFWNEVFGIQVGSTPFKELRLTPIIGRAHKEGFSVYHNGVKI